MLIFGCGECDFDKQTYEMAIKVKTVGPTEQQPYANTQKPVRIFIQKLVSLLLKMNFL